MQVVSSDAYRKATCGMVGLMIWNFFAKHCRFKHHFWSVRACVYLHSSTLLPFLSPLDSSTFLGTTVEICVWISSCGAAISNSFHLSSLTGGLCELEEELREENKIEIMLVISRKRMARTFQTARITEVCVKEREREKSHRTSRDVVKNLPWHMYFINVKLFSPLF